MTEQLLQSAPPDLGADWEWADNIDATALRRMAQVTRVLFAQPERWIHRRVDRISFKDHQVAHHKVSVDFTLPAGVPPIGKIDGEDIYIAPLFLLAKDAPHPPREGRRSRRRLPGFGRGRPDHVKPTIPTAPYSNLDFTDQNGRRIPLITRRQSGLLAKAVLLDDAERILGKPVAKELGEKISALPSRSWPDLAEVLSWILEEPAYWWCDPRIKLREDETFPELAYTIASHSIVACLLVDGPPRRSLYKLSYDEQLDESFSPRKGHWRQSLGWKPEQYSVPLNEVGGSASYHVEIEVPKELLIDSVNLFGKRYRWFGGNLLDRANRDYAIQQAGSASEGKIYIPQPLPGRRFGVAWVNFRMRRSGFLISAFMTSFVIMVMLIVAAFAVPVVAQENQSESAAAALLLVPALVAVYIARPGEHPITTKMLRRARFALVIDAIIPVFAVFLLIATLHTEADPKRVASDFEIGPFTLGKPSSVWIVLAAFSAVFTILFAMIYFAPRSRGETIYQPMPKSTD
jgi:hypothetical protein